MTKISYTPAAVSVDDERSSVPGASVLMPNGKTYEIIPQEGPSPDCWMGQLYYDCAGDMDEEWDAWRLMLADVALRGADGESGDAHLGDFR